jgi:hypothetical protein
MQFQKYIFTEFFLPPKLIVYLQGKRNTSIEELFASETRNGITLFKNNHSVVKDNSYCIYAQASRSEIFSVALAL